MPPQHPTRKFELCGRDRSDAAPPPFKCDCSGSGKLGTSGGDEFMGVDMLLLDSQEVSLAAPR
ncbi:unnamed protein product [Brassica rapa]|uniref:Uncharacterized protein n=1 Tax=Brassica campestris TaxID=3711 RepID=A0A8D9H507_BRACM|nr:unnamed protein product [Brassica rapa]